MTTFAAGRSCTWTDRHPLVFYFALTYAISWPLWLLSRLAVGTLGTVLLLIGGLVPRSPGRDHPAERRLPVGVGARGILRWRVPIAYYA